MDRMPVESKRHSGEIVAVLAVTAVLLMGYALWQSRLVQDLWRGWSYEEPENILELREELGLTEKGKRIFLATQPALESAAAGYNEHCKNDRVEVALLGCYVDDKMYIYDVTREDLRDSVKVTAAHELLHAVWARMGTGERERVEEMLEGVKREYGGWAEEELSLYEEGEKIEELYTRAGTKLRDLPEELERHYGEYFGNRGRIVEFYEKYQEPFEELKERNEELKQEVEKLGKEIEEGRSEYDTGMEELRREVDEFNRCAEEEGCFHSEAQFRRRRVELENREKELEAMRLAVNEKIERNNRAVEEYQENARNLGKLSDAMNSNVKKIE